MQPCIGPMKKSDFKPILKFVADGLTIIAGGVALVKTVDRIGASAKKPKTVEQATSHKTSQNSETSVRAEDDNNKPE